MARRHLRWWDGNGRYDDLYNDQPWTNPAKGLFLTLERKSSIDDDNSPFEIRDAHRNVLHFHVDGSIRFYVDREGNKTRFHYDRWGQLVRVEDSITDQRWLALEYFDAASGVIDAWVGRLRRVTDHTGREVRYDYYPDNDPDGGAGWLRQVTLPATRTMVAGAVVDNFSRYERYTYERDPDLEWRLKKVIVLDDAGSEQDYLVNHYSQGRIQRQEHGTSDFRFTFMSPGAAGAPASVLVQNRKGQQTHFDFPQSPYWDAVNAALAREVTAGNLETHRRYNYAGRLIEETIPGGEKTAFVFDDQSRFTRSRGNLLAKIHRAPSGESRIWTYGYSGRYNFVTREVGPGGNATGADPELFAIYHNYDRATGNVTAQIRPRLLNSVIETHSGNRRTVRWIDENPRVDFEYNVFGQLKRQVDTMGIVTTYTYHPTNDPAGSGGGTSSPDGGGFLASITSDAEPHARRDLHFPRLSPEPQAGTYRYNALGDVVEHVAPSGATHAFEYNALRERTQLTAAASRLAGIPGDPIVTEFESDPSGFLAQRELLQPSVGPAGGGPRLTEQMTHDTRGNLNARKVLASAGRFVEARADRDANDDVEHMYPFEHGVFSQTRNEIRYDDRRNVTAVTQGGDTHGYRSAPNGTLERFEGPGDGPYTLIRSPLGDRTGTVDPHGNVGTRIADSGGDDRLAVEHHGRNGGNPGRTYPAPPTSPVGAFSERRVDEGGRLTRLHRGRFEPAAPGTTTGTGAPALRYRKVTDYMPYPQGMTWPPVSGTSEPDGAWGRGDGRATLDIRYDAWNLPTWMTDDETGFAWSRRNARGQLVEVGDPHENRVEFDYDGAGNRTDIRRHLHYRDGGGLRRTKTLIERFEYDVHGRIVRSIDGEGNAHAYAYDETGHTHTYSDAMAPDSTDPPIQGHAINQPGNATIQERDALGRIVRTETALTDNGRSDGTPAVNPFNPSTQVLRRTAYYDGGPLKEIIEQENWRTEWLYYPDGKLHKIVCHGATRWDTTLNYLPGSSLVHTQTDGNGTVLTNAYEGDFITGVSAQLGAAGSGVRLGGPGGYTYRYHGDGQILSAVDSNGAERVDYTYDSDANPLSETQNGAAIASTFDGAGRRTGLDLAGYGSLRYDYDRSGRLVRVAEGGRTIASFEFMGDSRLVRRNLNGMAIHFDLDDAGRPQGVRVDVSPSLTVRYTLELDREGRIVRKVREFGSLRSEWSWQYDNVGRVVRENYDHWSGQTLVHERLFDGDDVIRRESRDVLRGGSVIHETIDRNRAERGRVTDRNGTALVYDRKGNLTDDGRRQYVYDAWDRLLRVEENGQPVTAYDYDAFHRLVRRTKGSEVEEYVWDGWSLVAVRKNGTIQERYVYGNNPEELLTAHVNGIDYSVLVSPEGNVDGLIDANRDVAEQYTYDLDGDATAYDAAGQARTGPALSRFLFKRRMFDAEGELYYFRHRWFHPALGMYLTPDPMLYAESPNHYGMTHGDPVNYTDVSGRYGWRDLWSDVKTTATRFAGGCYGAGANFAGFLRAGLYDSWGQTFDPNARRRVVQGQEWFGDGIEALRTGQFTNWVAEGVDTRIERVYRLEQQGEHFEAASVTGDTLMNGYYVVRAGSSGVRGGVNFARGVRANGFVYTVRASGASVRTWAVTYEGLGTGLESARGVPGIESSFRNSLLRRAVANEQPPGATTFGLRNLRYRLGRPNPGRYQSFLRFEDLGNGRVAITRQLASGAEGT